MLEPDVGAGLVWTWSSTAEAAEHGLPGEQLEALVDVVRAAEEADVACVLKGQDDGTWSVSLRSRGATDLARIAMELGGGGHTLAAGYTLDASTARATIAASCATQLDHAADDVSERSSRELRSATRRRRVRRRLAAARRWSSSPPSRCTCWSTPRSSATWAPWRWAAWPWAAGCWPGRRRC